MTWFLLAIVSALFVAVNCGAIYEIKMPGTKPQWDDLMLCYMRRVDSPLYIVGFNAVDFNQDINHHMIIFGCPETETGLDPDLDRVWNCGEVDDVPYSGRTAPIYDKAPICPDGQPPSFVWAWAMNAPPFEFPQGVSYKIGTKSFRYLVLQVHYRTTTSFRPPTNAVDRAGIQIQTISHPTPKMAGIYLLASSDGTLPPKEMSYFDIACRMDERGLDLHPFAVRTHQHGNGLVGSMYRIRNGRWTEIARQSPQMPQTFYPITNLGITIRQGDIVAARCTMYNKEDKPIRIGGTQYAEMCNNYIYYYTENGVEPEEAFCQSSGAPRDVWTEMPDINLAEMPKTVSLVPPLPPGMTPYGHSGHDHGNGKSGALPMVDTYVEPPSRRDDTEDDDDKEEEEQAIRLLSSIY